MKKSLRKFLVLPLMVALSSCGGSYDISDEGYSYGPSAPSYYDDTCYDIGVDTNTYSKIKENKFIDTSKNDKSTFSMCSSTAAYTNIKSLIEDRRTRPSADAVKIEQMLNYFSYDYALENDQTLGVFNEVSNCPWNADHKLASIAVKAKDADIDNKAMNLVFLIDVSGSMSSYISLMKEAFTVLINNLRVEDKISIVTYASNTTVVLDGKTGAEKEIITEKVNGLKAGGATYGSNGIQKAYEIAEKNLIADGNNRIILATDGDFNLGITKSNELEEFISGKRDTGVYLSVLGFGYGNYHDNIGETLAKNGNGNMFYINDIKEAKKLFQEGLSAAFEVVAKDSKAQVTFDKSQVAAFRMIGYENDLLTEEQFNDSETDAGEILSGDVTVALYELVLTNNFDPTKSLFKSELRFKDPTSNTGNSVTNGTAILKETMSSNFIFQAMVAEFGLLLRESAYKGSATYDQVVNMYRENRTSFELDRDKSDFYDLVIKTTQLF